LTKDTASADDEKSGSVMISIKAMPTTVTSNNNIATTFKYRFKLKPSSS